MAQDYTMKQYVDPASVASLFQQQKMQEQQMRQGNEQIAESKLGRSMKIMELASTMTQQLMKTVQDGQTKKLVSDYAAMASQPLPSIETKSGPKMAAQREADRQARMKELEAKLFPQQVVEANLKSRMPKAPDSPTGRPQLIRYSTAAEPTKARLGFADPNTKKLFAQGGAEITEPITASYALGFDEDPTTGEKIITNRGTGEVSSVKTPGQTSVETGLMELKQKAPKVAVKVETALLNSDPTQNKTLSVAVDGVTAANGIKTILSQEGKDMSQVGLQSLGFYFARASGSNSQLSDAERELFEAPIALLDKVTNKGYKLTQGDLSPKMRKDLQSLANTIKAKQTVQARKYLDLQKSNAKASAGSYWNKSIADQFPTIESLAANEADIQKEIIANSNESPQGGVPQVGGTYEGKKVKRVTRVR